MSVTWIGKIDLISEDNQKIKELDNHILKFVDEMDEAICYSSKEMAESAIECLQWSRKLFCGKALDFSEYLENKHKKKLASGKYYIVGNMLIPKDLELFKEFIKLDPLLAQYLDKSKIRKLTDVDKLELPKEAKSHQSPIMLIQDPN